MSQNTRIFGTDDICRALNTLGFDAAMDQLIERLQSAFESFDASKTIVPARDGFHYDSPRPGLIEWMPIMSRDGRALMKLVGYHPENPKSVGLPTILSSFSLMDTQTGHMIAISDGTLLTALRTGAASALATRAMANENGGTLGLIGCGAQAITQLHAISRVQPIELVLYWDTDCDARVSFVDRVSPYLSKDVRYRETPLNMLVPNADVLCTTTSIAVGEGPLFVHGVTKDGVHINAVGSDFPGKFEIPLGLLNESVVIPDFAEQAVAEGECQQLDPSKVGPELHQVLKSGDTDQLRNVRTVFDSTGWALEDLVAMEALIDWCDEVGVGRELRLESIPLDPKNPYLLVDAYDAKDNSDWHQRGRR